MNLLAASVAGFLVVFAGVDTAVMTLFVWPPQEKSSKRTHLVLIIFALVGAAGVSLLTIKGG